MNGKLEKIFVESRFAYQLEKTLNTYSEFLAKVLAVQTCSNEYWVAFQWGSFKSISKKGCCAQSFSKNKTNLDFLNTLFINDPILYWYIF